jgi:hypothetical protein
MQIDHGTIPPANLGNDDRASLLVGTIVPWYFAASFSLLHKDYKSYTTRPLPQLSS